MDSRNQISHLTYLFALSTSIFLLWGCQSQSGASTATELNMLGRGGLLTTHFQTLEELQEVVQIEYAADGKSWVRLTHQGKGHQVVTQLDAGLSEKDIIKTRDKGFFAKAALGIRAPCFVMHRQDLMRAYILSRKRDQYYGGGDVAFYHLAEAMMNHIKEEDLAKIPPQDISEKGYINTFNHMTAQCFITSIYSEELADFIADIHERNIPELITGKFTEKQLSDPKNGAVDNYVDMVNNEWGQELGKLLKQKYQLSDTTHWTPQLLTNFLNDQQQYYSWIFEIGFEPFRPSDIMVIRYAAKINKAMAGVNGMR